MLEDFTVRSLLPHLELRLRSLNHQACLMLQTDMLQTLVTMRRRPSVNSWVFSPGQFSPGQMHPVSHLALLLRVALLASCWV